MPTPERRSDATPRSLWREPLVVFLVFGVCVVALDLSTGGTEPDTLDATATSVGPVAPSSTIEVTDALIDDIARELEVRLERVPTDDEVTAAVDRWVDEEVFVREALARALHVDDAVIRAHLARKMTELFESREVAPEPTDDDLRALYDATLADWTVETQLTLRQVYARGPDAQAEAEALLARLEAGEAPVVVGRDRPTPPGGPVLRGRTPRRLASVYGGAFVEGLDTAPTDTWMLRQSSLGWHVVRVEGRRDGGPLPFDRVRDRLEVRWQAEQVDRAADEALDALRREYTVTGWPR